MATERVTTYDAVGNVLDERVETLPPERANRDAIEQTLRQAFTTNRDYIATTGPTAVQTTAQVKALSRQINALLRLTFGLLDGTD